jgi:hypothetical protein
MPVPAPDDYHLAHDDLMKADAYVMMMRWMNVHDCAWPSWRMSSTMMTMTRRRMMTAMMMMKVVEVVTAPV